MSSEPVSHDTSGPASMNASGAHGAPASQLNDQAQKWDDQARVWVFPLTRQISADERELLGKKLQSFLGGWAAHKQPVHGGSFFHRDWFLIVVADTTGATTSGCSIDSMTREVEKLLAEHSLAGGDPSDLFYLSGGQVVRTSRGRFRELAAEGSIGPETPVFDTTVTTLAPIRTGNFERPLRESWHARIAGLK